MTTILKLKTLPVIPATKDQPDLMINLQPEPRAFEKPQRWIPLSPALSSSVSEVRKHLSPAASRIRYHEEWNGILTSNDLSSIPKTVYCPSHRLFQHTPPISFPLQTHKAARSHQSLHLPNHSLTTPSQPRHLLNSHSQQKNLDPTTQNGTPAPAHHPHSHPRRH